MASSVPVESEAEERILAGPALRARRALVEWTRHAVQAGFLVTVPTSSTRPTTGWVALRPAAFAAFVVLLFAGGTLLARAGGLWRNAIGDEEYARLSNRGAE
jgi:hypothetical protein